MPKKPKDREDSESQLKSFSTNGNGDNVSQPSARSLTRSVKPAPPSAPKKHASAPASTTQREKQTAPLKRPEFASAGVWNDAKVRELWKRMSYETSFRDIQATYSDKKVAQALKKATEALDKAPIAETDTVNLLQHWVEMILRHAYKETREDQAQHTERYTEILYVCLNRRFLPEKYKSSDLAKRAGVAVNLADRFL